MAEPEGGAVECYAGHAYAEEPRALTWQGRRLLVEGVEARWRTPEGPAFRVGAEGGKRFHLQYHESDDRWTIVPLPDRRSLWD